jgi:hypothetical protein
VLRSLKNHWKKHFNNDIETGSPQFFSSVIFGSFSLLAYSLEPPFP